MPILDNILQQLASSGQFEAFSEKMRAESENLSQIQVVGEAAAGRVKITLNGLGEMTGCELTTAILSAGTDVLSDLICAAHNAAQRKLADEVKAAIFQRGANPTNP